MEKKRKKKSVTEQLKECRQLLAAERKASRDASRFLAGLSHDIRTQVTGMLGVLDMLGDFKLEARAANYVKVVGESASSLLDTVNDILDYSKMEAGRFTLDSVPFDPAEVLERTLEPYRLQAEARGVPMSLEVDAGVPLAVKGDPRRLGQIVSNLAANALAHTQKGRIDVSVDRVSEPGDDVKLCFSVSDTGVGIPEELHDVMFQRYVQMDGEPGGTGLGLAICRGLVELMKGEISVASAPGKGSLFRFTARFERAKPSDLDETPPAPVPSKPRRKSLRFLLAEDNEMNREYMAYFLQGRGHRVMEAENGRAALEVLAGGGIDVVLLDMRMPIMDGLETLGAIRSGRDGLDPRIPVIGLTAHAMPEDRDRALDAGMDEYLVKPVDMNRLESMALALCADRVPGRPGGKASGPETVRRPKARTASPVPGRLGVLFATQTPPVMEAIRSSARNGDMEVCRERAHFLAGSAIAVREGRLVELCRAVERGAASGNVDLVQRLLDDLEEEYALVIGRMQG